MAVRISRVSCEHFTSGFGVDDATPRLSWRFEADDGAQDWEQAAYSIRLSDPAGKEEAREYKVDSSDSVLVPWPADPLVSGQRITVGVCATSTNGQQTNWASLDIEVALLNKSEWTASMISCPPQDKAGPKRPFRVRRSFNLDDGRDTQVAGAPARLYVTAFGMYEMYLNGSRIGDQVLPPGWTSYSHRLHYQTYDISALLVPGENVLGGYVAEGWYTGRLGWGGGNTNLYGDRNALQAQLVMGGETVLTTDSSWSWSYGPIISSELYCGEVYDANIEDRGWSTASSQSTSDWQPVDVIEGPKGQLIADRSPVRRQGVIRPVKIIQTPAGKTILDFGQNLVGWLRFRTNLAGQARHEIRLAHAEVLEHGELGIRPLRHALQRDVITLGAGSLEGWEPTFTYHGFRFVQVDNWPKELQLDDLEAVYIHSEMERTGTFECSHPDINQLHENVVWSMRGNFVSLPTDCPQRNERLGWTGDLQVFATTASYLFDCSSMLNGWMQDFQAEHLTNKRGEPPIVVPDILQYLPAPTPFAVWSDAAVLTPYDLYCCFGDTASLSNQWESMTRWVDVGVKRGEDGLWDEAIPQLGDWLDPAAPPESPIMATTDNHYVANAYLLRVTRTMAKIAIILGKAAAADKYAADFQRLQGVFLDKYVAPSGRIASDSQCGLALALHFDLIESDRQKRGAAERLDYLVRRKAFQVATGFAGTPIILDTLAEQGKLSLAYRMLQEKGCPSWLYPISMGATTIWERWNSVLPDGTINPGEMTSMNHFALGSVARFLHGRVGGISPLTPGWKKILIRPQPGGDVTSARVTHISPYGQVACSWSIQGGELQVDVTVPPNSSAQVELPGLQRQFGSGSHRFSVPYEADSAWPPQALAKSVI